MKAKRIKRVFERFFEHPNPIFCIPVAYFRHGDFLCELARTKSYGEVWNLSRCGYITPHLIMHGLFVDNGLWLTVLERKDRNSYVHRHDLCAHVGSFRELNSLVNKMA